MGFLERAAVDASAADGTLAQTLDRIRAGTDFSANPTPAFDPKQAKDWQDANAQGRTDEPYRQALLYHGFVWWPLAKLQAQGLPGGHLLTEGQWRNLKLDPPMGFTPRDLALGFPEGPESFDKFIREHKLAMAVKRGRVPKEALVRARRRR